MKALKDLSDKASDYLDKKGLANPAEVLNEAFGGETREESKKRREEANFLKNFNVPMEVMVMDDEPKKPAKKETTAPVKKETTTPVKKAKGGMVGSASKRADGCAVKGKTRGRIV
jgi:hypothetical protein